MGLISLVAFFAGVVLLTLSLFVYVRRLQFPHKRTADVDGSVCGSDECQLSVSYNDVSGGRAAAKIMIDDRTTRKQVAIRLSDPDGQHVVVDYPLVLSAEIMVAVALLGFVLCTAGLTSIIYHMEAMSRSKPVAGF